MLILVVMSIYSWTVILSKKKILLDSKGDIKDFSKYFSTDKTLNELQFLYHQWNTARFKTIGVQTCHGYLRFK
jgi:biopolymer transport protein TolQ